MISLTDSQKIGMGLTGFGVFFLFFGMILFFDKALLAIGNILFVAGLAFVIGLERTFRFFFQKHKMKATGFFLGGVFVVLIGWPIIGVVLEVYGFFLLFRGFFPVVIGFIRRIPVLGSILNLPFIRAYVDKAGESNTMQLQLYVQIIPSTSRQRLLSLLCNFTGQRFLSKVHQCRTPPVCY
ncbi:vesicle transport protein GOT1B [Solea senegalensis]|uniref:Vesicle transport protein GOT1B n=1 Tax=Solea senegalensis TaxID=28829 RepID=A0AAV6QXG8_SOLSE|nr:vesicle transport protein GOT1B [Solea senegalensis]